jgi:hypothetical protein
MMRKQLRLYKLGFLLLLLLLLAGCGGGEEPAPTPAPTAVPPPATATQPAAIVSPLPTPTPPAAVSPLMTETEVVTGAQPITATNGISPAASGATVFCPFEPDLDLAGYTDLELQMGCAVETARFNPVAINEFGEGPEYDRFMLWFGDEQQIYVLLPDGQWGVHPDTWTEDQPTFTCNPLGGDEDSPPLPRRGFGKVWCSVEGLADIMGPVPREERLCQHTVVQRFEQGRLLACYEDATIRYVRLFDDNTWDTVLTR